MRSIISLLALTLLSFPAAAQIRVEVGLPMIRFEARPPLVVVEPGIQVVQDYDDEVYVVDNVYWMRRGGRWYRSPDHRGHWVNARREAVPVRIVHYAPGQYRRFHGGGREQVMVAPSREVVESRRGGHGHGRGHDNGRHEGHGHGHD